MAVALEAFAMLVFGHFSAALFQIVCHSSLFLDNFRSLALDVL